MPTSGPQARLSELHRQYERHPYPPVPWMALPRPNQGAGLRYELGLGLGQEITRPKYSHVGIRILVAGAGTLEALVVAQAHPLALHVIAVDLSSRSVQLLRKRTRFARIARPWTKLPRIDAFSADLTQWQPDEPFDYILASNVLHHLIDPAAMLRRLASWLKPDGLLRMVTYPKTSRLWMRETSDWLKANGVTPGQSGLLQKAKDAIAGLPKNHPIRSCFSSQPETGTQAGLIDAFLNACEYPLSPLAWKEAADHADLLWLGETQAASSRSSFLSELVQETSRLKSWERLQIMDHLLELCANPVLWFRKSASVIESKARAQEERPSNFGIGILAEGLLPELLTSEALLTQKWRLPSRSHSELGQALRHARALLSTAEVPLERVLDRLKSEVGPRVSSGRKGRLLPGLSVTEYDARELESLPRPWEDADWRALEQRMPGLQLFSRAFEQGVPGKTLSEQARWLQGQIGPLHSWIDLRFGSQIG